MQSFDSEEILTFESHGAERFCSVLNSDEVEAILSAVSGLPSDHAGIRIYGITALDIFISNNGKIGNLVQCVLGQPVIPVRAVLFDKNPLINWSLKWHQDRTIIVKQRIETAGYETWSVKSGLQHVEPPYDLLTHMVTVRIHLDQVDVNNAPLLIVPGSHRLGRIPEPQIESVVSKYGIYACMAHRGDVWLYSTPIIHASEAAKAVMSRRVLQIDYAAATLPNGLDWLGV